MEFKVEKTLWHPVVMLGDLRDAPHAVTLLGEDIVLWRDGAGAVRAMKDQCPHRGAKLSMGRVENGRLECGYHGWQFEGGGRCVHVPALPAFTPPAGHCVQAYGVREAYGLVWVQLELADAALPPFDAEMDERLRKVTAGPYAVQTSAPRIVENFLDMSHFGFVHTGWLGDRAHVAMEDYEVASSPDGILATQCKAWQPKSSVHATTGAMVEYTYAIRSPYSCVLTKIPEASAVALDGFYESIALFVCPVTPEMSRVWIRMAMTKDDSPDQSLIDFQNTIFGQDQPVLESQRPKCLPLDLRAELHTVADKASSAYRRYLTDKNITFGVKV
jgi:phenylpropionate dioxygenase-like ring-hydroxylating dioxygenase large terminal subunit